MTSSDPALNDPVKARVEELQLHRGPLRCLAWRIRLWFFRGPRAEIAHDVQVVESFAKRAIERLQERTGAFEAGKGETETDQGKAVTAKRGGGDAYKSNLVDVLALLECAKTESDFAQAWTYVNLADALLTLVVADDELPACVSRLTTADRRLPEDIRGLVPPQRIPENVAALLQAAQAWAPADAAGAALKKQIQEVLKPTPSTTKRNEHHADQLVRTFLWNGVNRKISLKLSLWASIRRRLLFALFAFFAAVALSIQFKLYKDPSWAHLARLLAIGLLGLFGGMLSAFLTAREEEVHVPSYQVVLSGTSLRMLLGGAGAIVTYSVGLLLISEQLQNLIHTNLFAFMTIGIVAGFSERLFIDTLEKAASNLHTTGSPTKAVEKNSSGGPKPNQTPPDGPSKVDAGKTGS
jgi:hypothetical protein